MSRPRLVLALVLSLVLPALARAERARVAIRDPARALQVSMQAHAAALARVRARHVDGVDPIRDALTCELAIRAARAAKLPPTLEVTSTAFGVLASSYRDARGTHLQLRDAGALCDELARWEKLVRAQLSMQRVYALAHAAGTEALALALEARVCRSRVDDAVAAGFAPTLQIAVAPTVAVALAEAGGAICEAGQIAPYAVVAVGADRASLLDRLHGRAVYGAGGVELTTPRVLASARLLFVVDVSGALAYVTRYELAGDRIAGVSSTTHATPPGRAAFR